MFGSKTSKVIASLPDNMISHIPRLNDWRNASIETIGTGNPSYISPVWVDAAGDEYSIRITRSELALRWQAAIMKNGTRIWDTKAKYDTPNDAYNGIRAVLS